MKNVLKVLLRKNQMAIEPNEYNAQVSITENVGIEFILDEMQKEGMKTNRETARDIISRFNLKSTELVVSGYEVNTGLVNMRPLIKGSIYGKIWNPKINWVDISIYMGRELYRAINKTTVEIIGEQGETLENYDAVGKTNQLDENTFSFNRKIDTRHPLLNTKEVPACGMAFREWLCKS